MKTHFIKGLKVFTIQHLSLANMEVQIQKENVQFWTILLCPSQFYFSKYSSDDCLSLHPHFHYVTSSFEYFEKDYTNYVALGYSEALFLAVHYVSPCITPFNSTSSVFRGISGLLTFWVLDHAYDGPNNAPSEMSTV